MIKKNVNETLGFNYYFKKTEETVDKDDIKTTVEIDAVKDDMKITELFEKNIGKRMRDMVELETRAKKEIDLSLILDELAITWDKGDKESKFILDPNTKEITKSETIFDDIDESFAKVADIQSNK